MPLGYLIAGFSISKARLANATFVMALDKW